MVLGLLVLLLSTASVAGAAPFAFVSYPSTGSGRVAVIDSDPNAVCPVAGQTPPCVVKTLVVGVSPVGVAVNPAGTFAYVANAGDNSVSVIRISNNPSDITVVRSILVGFGPWGVAVSPDNAKVYVGLSDGSVAVIDVNNSDHYTVIPVGGMPNGIVAAGSRVYVSDATNSQVVVIDGPTQSVIRKISVGAPPNSDPMGLVANPSWTRVYVTDIGFDMGCLIDVLEGSVIDTNPALVDDPRNNPVVQTLVIDPYPLNPCPTDNTGAAPSGIAMSPDGSRLYVANNAVNPDTHEALNKVTIITLSDGSRAYVGVGTTRGPSPFVSPSPSSIGIATDPTGRVYVANELAGTVSVFDPSVLDPSTNAPVVKTIDIGGQPLVFGAFTTAGPPQFMLTLTTAGGGSIAALPTSVTGKYEAGTEVILTATPDGDSQFASWSGACSGTVATCKVTMDAAKSVTATFTAQYALVLTPIGDGSIAAVPAPGPLAGKYPAGTEVTLTATPGGSSAFSSWSGACSGITVATCKVTMDAATSVTATFTAQYALVLTPIGDGSIAAVPDPGPLAGKYPAGTEVTLTATPGSSSAFTSWSGACSGTVATCKVTMDAAKSVTATFTAQYALALTTLGDGTIAAAPAPGPLAGKYPTGTEVTLTATPGSSSVFTSWSGACSGTVATCKVTMDAAKSVTATFTAQYALALTMVGDGSIAAVPAPGPLAGKYPAGTAVTLTATPGPSSVFTGWSGACSGTVATCTVPMSAPKNVTATFTAQYALVLTPIGDGSITAAPAPGPLAGKYPAGTAVTLTATPGPSSVFTGWSGACSGTVATCNVTIDAAKSVTATFAAQEFTLTLTTEGSGSIGVAPSPTAGKYAAGLKVNLQANPNAGSKFGNWSGDCSGAVDTCQVTMSTNKNVKASFVAVPPPPPPTTCDDKIKDLQQKVAASKSPWRYDHQLKQALKMYSAASVELARAKAKPGGESDRRFARALKDFNDGKAALCQGQYWRAHREFWSAYYIAREILKSHPGVAARGDRR